VAAGTTAATPGQPLDVVRHVDAVGNIDVVSHIRDLGSDDNLGHAGNVGIDGNVRLRFEQHCCIVEPDIKRRPPRRASALEREFRWELTRSAIAGLVPRQQYR
jgi:hypothetical protein